LFEKNTVEIVILWTTVLLPFKRTGFYFKIHGWAKTLWPLA